MRVGLASGSARSRAAGACAARRSLPLLRDVELGVLLMLGLSNLVAVAGGGPLPTGELLWVMVVYLVAGVSVTVALGFAVGGSLLRRMR